MWIAYYRFPSDFFLFALWSILDASVAGEESQTSDLFRREMQLQILHLSSLFLNEADTKTLPI